MARIGRRGLFLNFAPLAMPLPLKDRQAGMSELERRSVAAGLIGTTARSPRR